jgi:hypothetical protein
MPMMCTRVSDSPMTSPATVALLARLVTARMTNTNRKVRITSARNAPPAFAPIMDEAPKPSAPSPVLEW